ncbi:electron transport complex subunit RsxC [Bermanella sp. WJH001]|uniref:electron transport complex subunit RsxC n=1 Tax=Bermanella sp. WJH001 TaxID=3048005 RepID=UPI0024BE35E2|nr:electron transport complex subunit RsxC [Bermanella sp. WJH001]MDJ1536948.1 electron transport complex subunit RsxC [Bermanella sp. WJH001]
MNLITLHEFDGGIHPPQNKDQSTQSPIIAAKLPEKLILPIAQHIGAQSKPVVNLGDTVLKGQVIAEAQGFVSANLHAPSSGKITAIEERVIAHPSGMSDICIEITLDGDDKWCDIQGIDNYLEAEPKTLIDKIQTSGITGLGGAGFPTHVKASVEPNKIQTLIINAAECEPYITSDDMLMREHANGIIKGIEILERIVKPEHCLIGVEDNKPEAIAALKDALKNFKDNTFNIEVVTIPTKYPSGGEKQLIQILTGKEVPAGGLPSDIGIVCQNVGTCFAIYKAISKGEPLISRITTITGEACAKPQNFEVLIGTPVKHLLELAHAQTNNVHRLIMGGPMMGFTLENADTPIVKASNCIIASSKQELPDPAMEQACIRCGMCTEACPAQLLPQQLYWFSKSSNLEQATAHNIADCIECGACAYVCPSNIPLVQYYRHTKGEIKQANADKQKSDRAKDRFEARLARQEREAAEKEAKRKARAEAAAKKQAEKKAAEANGTNELASATQAPAADLEALQRKLDASQMAVKKAKEKIAAAQEANDSDKVELLTGALKKAQEKMKEAAKAIAEAKKAAKAAPASSAAEMEMTPERMQKKVEMAQSRLATAQKRLDEAVETNSDKVDALKTAVENQQARVAEAKQALAEFSSTPAKTETAKPAVDIELLKQKVLAAQTRVDKAQERLEMAQEQNLDTIDAFKTGLEKQQAKLDDAKKALAEASA